jgi:hypothetical protein
VVGGAPSVDTSSGRCPECIAAILLLALSGVTPVDLAWLPIIVAFGLLEHGGWLVLASHRDRFVITNMRVFRVHGVLTQSLTTMPLSRMLDSTVRRPVLGRMLG